MTVTERASPRADGTGRMAQGGWHRADGTGRMALGGWHWADGTGRMALGGWHWADGTERMALRKGEACCLTRLRSFEMLAVSSAFDGAVTPSQRLYFAERSSARGAGRLHV